VILVEPHRTLKGNKMLKTSKQLRAELKKLKPKIIYRSHPCGISGLTILLAIEKIQSDHSICLVEIKNKGQKIIKRPVICLGRYGRGSRITFAYLEKKEIIEKRKQALLAKIIEIEKKEALQKQNRLEREALERMAVRKRRAREREWDRKSTMREREAERKSKQTKANQERREMKGLIKSILKELKA